ncbi:NADPH-dependent FMN reductase [Rheinheimera sp.]|jgi:chromate reductase|uniref:NADPH-dependent FMN reductase n=1 Tax=Rheinheimera sp. TaxID=1869214 RepID=UPI00261752AD|nr:NAD(P)H-dependent oxidoreductase [Rheinheimera sp.]MCA1928315.1 NAD(P)H-dependent oxidoreductase [Rheinheimera sp.]
MSGLKVLALCGSLRAKSTNKALVEYAIAHAPQGMQIELADLSDVPFFNADLTAKPVAVERLLAQFASADALLLACPEYNYSIAPALKNALDWASREPNNALLAGKVAAIMGSGGGMGTSRAQYHLRQVCVFLDVHLVNKPEVFCNAFANSFDAEVKLTDERIQNLIVQQLTALQQLAARFKD